METPRPPQISVSGRIVIEGELPVPSSTSPEKGTAQTSRPWWKLWEGDPHTRAANATVLLALGTFALATFSLIQICDFREQERVQLRAYVFPVQTQIQPLPANEWFMGPLWENSGVTPARGLFVYRDCVTDADTKEGHIFDYQKIKQNADYYPRVLGPHQHTAGTGCFYTADQIADLQHTGKVVYLGEEADYKDIFNQPHLTRVCLDIKLLGDPKIANPQVEHVVTNCKHGNCDDEECRRQDREPHK